MAEIIDRLLAVALAVNNRRHLEPYQVALVVVINTSPPVHPVPARSYARHSDGCVQERAPCATRTSQAQIGGDAREGFMVLLRGPQSAARSEQRAEIIRETLIDPKQVRLHRRFVIRSAQIRWTSKLAIPRVG